MLVLFFTRPVILEVIAYISSRRIRMSDKGGIVWREPFDVKGDKTGKDHMYLDNIRSGHVADNTHHRNLYIANPQKATGSFTVEVSV